MCFFPSYAIAGSWARAEWERAKKRQKKRNNIARILAWRRTLIPILKTTWSLQTIWDVQQIHAPRLSSHINCFDDSVGVFSSSSIPFYLLLFMHTNTNTNTNTQSHFVCRMLCSSIGIDVFTRNGKNRGSKTRIKERARKSYTRTLERNVLTECAAASKPRRTQSRHNVYPRGSRKKKRNKVSQAKKEGTLIRKEKWYVRVCLRLFLSWYFMATTVSMPMLSALENFFFSIAAPRKRKIHLILIITQLTTIECGIFIWCSLHWVSFCSHRKTNDS